MLYANYIFSQNQGHKLYQAIQSGDEKEALKILSSVSTIRLRDINDPFQESSTSPLILAIPYTNIFKQLLTKYHNQITSWEKVDILNYAIQNNYPKPISIILQLCKQDIGNEDMIQALILSVKYGHISVLNTLLNDPSILSLSAYHNNAALREAQTSLSLSKDTEEKECYQTIINHLMQIPSIALLELIENKKNIRKIKEILAQNHHLLNKGCLGFALIKASENNYIKAISALLKQPNCQIQNYKKGFALVRAIERGHLESVNTLLSYDSMLSVISWCDHAPLREAHIQFNKAIDKKRKIYQSIINILTKAYDKIWNNIELDSAETRDLKFEIILNRIKNNLINPKVRLEGNFTLIDKINRLDIRILKFIQKKLNCTNNLDKNETFTEIELNENEINQYINTFLFPDEQLNNFIEDTKLYFSQPNFVECHIEEISHQFKSFNFEAKSYSDFIRICSKNMLKIFPNVIYDAVQTQIAILENPSQLTPHFTESAIRKRKRNDDFVSNDLDQQQPAKYPRLT